MLNVKRSMKSIKFYDTIGYFVSVAVLKARSVSN